VGTFQGTRAAPPPEAGFTFFIAFFILFFVVIAFFCLINHTAAVAVALIGHRLEVSHSGPEEHALTLTRLFTCGSCDASCLLAKHCFRCMPVELLNFARRCP